MKSCNVIETPDAIAHARPSYEELLDMVRESVRVLTRQYIPGTEHVTLTDYVDKARALIARAGG